MLLGIPAVLAAAEEPAEIVVAQAEHVPALKEAPPEMHWAALAEVKAC